jgi:hypothetical protein
MEKRTLTVTIKPDWRTALRAAARDAFAADAYRGETSTETPAAFFSRLTEKRWTMLYSCKVPEKWPCEPCPPA